MSMFMTDQFRHSVQVGRHHDRAASAARPIVARIRFQLVGGLLVAVILPAIARYGLNLEAFASTSASNTLIGAAIAVMLGFAFNRQLVALPGARGSAYILPTYGFAFLLVFLVFFLLRLDYARFVYLASLGLSIGWFYAMHFAARRVLRIRLAIVPGTTTDALMDIQEVDWMPLLEPTRPGARCDGVVVDLRANMAPEWERFVADCALAHLPVFNVKQVRESLTGRVEIEHLSENTLGSLIPNHAYFRIKSVVDTAAAVILLPLLAPFLVVLGLAIRLDSPGPALFRQTRRGYLGHEFTVYKFRTMFDDTDRQQAARDEAVTSLHDSRVTRLGRLLRHMRLDELPQILNVLRGEMSWIGPRPEALSLADWYEAELPFYRYRAIVRPGITGWAQVNQGHVADVDAVRHKLHYDFYYIKHFSPWLDILIALRTLKAMLTGYGAR